MYRISRQGLITLIIGLVGLAVLLAMRSEGADGSAVLGRYSLRYAAVIAAYVAVMAAGVVVLSLGLPNKPDWLWAMIAVAGLGIAAWLPLLDHTWWLNTTLKLSVGWLVLALVWRSGAVFDLAGRWRLIWISFGLLLLVVNVLSLVEFPRFQMIDEGWDANIGWTFTHEGVLYTRMNQGVFGIPEQFSPVANVLPGYWFAVAGLGIFQARTLILFGGFVMAALTYATAYHLYRDRAVAFIATILLAASYTFVSMSHLFRLDVYLGLAGIAALSLFLYSRQRPVLGLLSGFILAAAVEIHQTAALLCVSAGLYLVFWIAYRSIRSHRIGIYRRDVYFMVGGVIGASLFLFFHVLPSPADFVKQSGFSIGLATQAAADWTTSLGPLAFIVRGVLNYVQVAPFETALMLLLSLLAWRARQARPMALLLLVVVAVYSILSPSLAYVYFIDFWPLVALVCAGALAHEMQRRSVLAVAICLAVAMPLIVGVIQVEQEQFNRHLMAVAAQIDKDLRPTDKVVALHTYFLLLPDPPELIAPFMHTYAEMTKNPVQGAQVWEDLAPDVFIVSSAVGEHPDPVTETYRQQHGFVRVASYDQAGCCVFVYRRPGR